jgi:hypothetical protein
LNKKNNPTPAIAAPKAIILKARSGKNLMIKKRKVAGIKKIPVGRVKYNRIRKSKIAVPFFKSKFFLVKRK